MVYELPFKIINSLTISNGATYSVAMYKNAYGIEISSKGGIQFVKLGTGNDRNEVDMGKCNKLATDYRGVRALYRVAKNRFYSSITIYPRITGCVSSEAIHNIKIINVFKEADTFAVVYKKGNEYFAIIDDIGGFLHTRISSIKPKTILYEGGVIAVRFDDFVRVVSPVTGIVDIPLRENIEPLGYDTSTNTAILVSHDTGIVFSVDSSGYIEILASCTNMAKGRSIKGDTYVLCDLEPINSSFFPFYSAKVFLDVFKSTENIDLLHPYILSVVKLDSGKELIIAQILSSKVYVDIEYNSFGKIPLAKTSIYISRRIGNNSEFEIDSRINNIIQELFGQYYQSDEHSTDIYMRISVFLASNEICYGVQCGKCIVSISAIPGEILEPYGEINANLVIGNKVLKEVVFQGDKAITAIKNVDECNALINSKDVYICINENEKCYRSTALNVFKIDDEVKCKLDGVEGIDLLRIKCSLGDNYYKIVSQDCVLAKHSTSREQVLRLVIRRDQPCLLGLVNTDGFLLRKRVSPKSYFEDVESKLAKIDDFDIEETRNGYVLLVKATMHPGLVVLELDDIPHIVQAGIVALRASGKHVLRLWSRNGVIEDSPAFPETEKIVLFESCGREENCLYRIVCPKECSCTFTCNGVVSSGSEILVNGDDFSAECKLLLTCRGMSKLLRFSNREIMLNLAVLEGRKLAGVANLL
ncbi:hypothetical protein PYJP_10480 [Pyrofollis japonicus]|nr:hypothetical protein PYJP_10480 [Pyrofollis japonicus]